MIVSVTTAKMTGLDLGPPPLGSSRRGEDGCEGDSLTTPKVEPSASLGGEVSSPRLRPPSNEDMLTTPVLTTPKTAEYWSTLGKDIPFSPTPLVSLPPQPPRELPMDSDIGLRSPCDGLLHKRRMFKNKINSGNSVNSDSNSCDTTPCSADNSPRDLSVSSHIKEEEEEGSRGGSAPHSSAPVSLRRQISKPPEGGNKNSSNNNNNNNIVNFQQSPLAVPSPNWNVVERYIGVEILKTPKLLDNSFFDFLVPPTTPKNGKISGNNRDISPGSEADRYSGRDQRLSPRLSPRFPIPEAPTDLSKSSSGNNGDRIPPLARIDAQDYEAEDLSMSKHQPSSNNNNDSTTKARRSPSPPPMPAHCKQEEDYSPPSVSSSHMSSSHIHEPPPQKTIKTEMDASGGNSSLYEYSRQPASFPHPLYFPPQFHSALYHRQIYSELQQQQQGNHVRSSPHHQMDGYEGYGAQSQHMAQQMVSHHHPGANSHWHAAAASSHHWTVPSNNDDSAMEEDNSSSSPPYHKAPTISVKPPSALLGKSESKKPGGTPLKKRAKDHSSSSSPSNPSKSPSEKPRAKEGLKRTYVCPHCQRSYDWNYNLNRHLKYECGKENAFQCSKCSRKFPHKQNCVYHLKRKHKIICDSIDQYVSKGFVIFQGAASASPPSSSGLSGSGSSHLGSPGVLSRESIATSS